jgi:hypothetical protein
MSFLKFIWKSKSTRWQIVLTGILVIVFLALLFRSLSQSKGLAEMWQSWMEPFLAFSTILIAVFIWYNEKKQDWESALPKKLDVSFQHQDEVIYRVRNAPLAGDDDIRQWGQQIGRQMNKGDLLFNGFKVEGPNRETDKTGKDVMRYTLTVWLQRIEEGKTEKTWEYDDDGKLIEA